MNSSSCLRALLYLLLSSAAPLGVAPAQEPAPAELVVLFENFSYVGTTGRVDVSKPRITQGEIAIEADRGSADQYDLDRSEWRLVGNVTMHVGTDRITGDSASFGMRDRVLEQLELEGDVTLAIGSLRIRGNRLRASGRDQTPERFELEGAPATFEDLEPRSAGRASGRAERLTYDAVGAVVGLIGNAELAVGPNEWTGCDLIYDVDEETFSSGSTECDRPFELRITPSEPLEAR
jgi:lipopolysaccharide transport protein LptA